MENAIAERCDPALLSCITGAEIRAVLPFIAIALIIIGVWRLIRYENRKHMGYIPKRGAASGQGQSIHMTEV